jgi:choline kinase
MYNKVGVILFSAGIGSRIRHRTLYNPKVLLMVNDNPILKYWLDKSIMLRPRKIIVNTHYLSEKIDEFISSEYQNNSEIIIKYENEPIILSQIKKYKIFGLPKEFISFQKIDKNNPLHMEAYNYLKNRKVSNFLIKKDNLGFCLEGYYKNRIIIPSYDSNNKINFYVTRTFKDDPYKYKLPQADKKEIIFNEKNINWNATVYIVEAYFEYTTIPINTIILLGKSLQDNILSKLIKYKPNVIIMLNPDAIEKRQDFNYSKTPNSSLEIQERLLNLGLTNVMIQTYNNDFDLNENMQNYGKTYIFNLMKTNLKQ